MPFSEYHPDYSERKDNDFETLVFEPLRFIKSDLISIFKPPYSEIQRQIGIHNTLYSQRGVLIEKLGGKSAYSRMILALKQGLFKQWVIRCVIADTTDNVIPLPSGLGSIFEVYFPGKNSADSESWSSEAINSLYRPQFQNIAAGLAGSDIKFAYQQLSPYFDYFLSLQNRVGGLVVEKLESIVSGLEDAIISPDQESSLVAPIASESDLDIVQTAQELQKNPDSRVIIVGWLMVLVVLGASIAQSIVTQEKIPTELLQNQEFVIENMGQDLASIYDNHSMIKDEKTIIIQMWASNKVILYGQVQAVLNKYGYEIEAKSEQVLEDDTKVIVIDAKKIPPDPGAQ